MYCQNCNEQPANVHITQIINGKKQEIYLCEKCAQNKQIGIQLPQISFTNLLGTFLNQPYVTEKKEVAGSCPNCQVPYQKVAEVGRLGCSECYSHFSKHLEPVLRKIHGVTQHRGKIPQRTGAALKLYRELDELKHSQKRAIEREEYEEAARLRDKIKELEKKIECSKAGEGND